MHVSELETTVRARFGRFLGTEGVRRTCPKMACFGHRGADGRGPNGGAEGTYQKKPRG